MKRLLFLMLIFTSPLVVYADSISLSCPDKINEAAEFNCELSGYTDTSVSSLSANIKLSGGLTFVGFIPSRSWEGDGANGDIDLYTLDIKKGTFTIGTLKVKSDGSTNSSVTVSSVFFYDENDKEKTVNSVSKTIQMIDKTTNKADEPSTTNNSDNNNNSNNNEPSNSNSNTNRNTSNNGNSGQNINTIDSPSFYLIDLKIDGYKLDFIREQTEYTLKINNESTLSITPVLEDNSSSYEILGNDNLKDGSIVRIQVTTKDGNKETYRITIKKDNIEKKNYTHIFIIVIGLLVLVNIIRIIISKRKKNGGVSE